MKKLNSNTVMYILSIYVLAGGSFANAAEKIDHNLAPLDAPAIESQYNREISGVTDHKFDHKIDHDIKPRIEKKTEPAKSSKRQAKEDDEMTLKED